MDFLWINPDPIGLTVGGNGQDQLWGEWSCNGQDVDVTNLSNGRYGF